jgi:hypothetical protein
MTTLVLHLGFFNIQTQEVDKIKRRCANNTCSLDVILIAFFANSTVLSVVLPIITELVNTSIFNSHFYQECLHEDLQSGCKIGTSKDRDSHLADKNRRRDKI